MVKIICTKYFESQRLLWVSLAEIQKETLINCEYSEIQVTKIKY